MSSGASREHHWWPVALQTYWADRNGNVSWIGPDGRIEKKKAKNRKIAYKSHGHTLFKGGSWETNFEREFASADDQIHRTIEAIKKLKPLGSTPNEFFGLMKLFFKRDRHLKDMSKFYALDKDVHRSLLLLLFSILIRSPGNRSRYESYSTLIGFPPNEEVGKANLRQTYLAAKRLIETSYLSHHYFILIYSPWKKFIFGDGSLDWLTGSLMANRIDGKALLPLTPNICLYFCTPRSMRRGVNCASFSAAPWIVDWINDTTQIYSRDKLFFLGKPPQIGDVFRQRQFLEHGQKSDHLVDLLDEIAGIEKYKNVIAFTASF